MNRILEFWPVGILFASCCVLTLLLGGGWLMAGIGIILSSIMTMHMIKRGV